MNMLGKKLISILLVVGIVFATGCNFGSDSGSDAVDPTKTTVWVMNYDGGLGEEWLDAAEVRFEKKYKDIELAEGKKGIDIKIESKGQNGDKVLSYIKGAKYAIYFTEYVNYTSFVNQNVLMDITDVLTDKLTEYGENKSIIDKMDSNLSGFLNVGTESQPKYYAAPFYEAYTGIMYDVDLFEQKKFYFNTDGGFIQGYFDDDHVYHGTDTLSFGPDGKTGVIDGYDYSVDDGLPATYDQFFALCDYMLSSSVTPLIWPGANQDYINELILNLWSDYEGVDRMMLNYTFNGEDDSIVDEIKSDGSVKLKTIDITPANGYLTYGQAGKYYALQFVERIMRGSQRGESYTVNNIMSTGMSHKDCDTSFLKGPLDTKFETIGMMINGTWFENEATEVFNSLSSVYGEKATKQGRRIGVMPYPKATSDKVGEVSTPLCMKSALSFMNNNITESDVKQAAKMFLKYVMTDESLGYFQQIVGMPWALNYSINDQTLSGCTYYSQSLYNLHNQRNVVYPYDKNEIYKNNISMFMSNKYYVTMKMENGKIYDIPTSAFYQESSMTAKMYFEGILRNMNESEWNKKFGKLF